MTFLLFFLSLLLGVLPHSSLHIILSFLESLHLSLFPTSLNSLLLHPLIDCLSSIRFLFLSFSFLFFPSLCTSLLSFPHVQLPYFCPFSYIYLTVHPSVSFLHALLPCFLLFVLPPVPPFVFPSFHPSFPWYQIVFPYDPALKKADMQQITSQCRKCVSV
ncbi:hypothetical protein CHARACLAT_024570 [Characodon lateralis]|uniref:Uncharacterized protein n=1 Tax=Characodon lateralis TaxID=208331 RepID=A0ABU7DVK5_9TELE|nr:hypothetical protein [Characodon lateralis]